MAGAWLRAQPPRGWGLARTAKSWPRWGRRGGTVWVAGASVATDGGARGRSAAAEAATGGSGCRCGGGGERSRDTSLLLPPHLQCEVPTPSPTAFAHRVAPAPLRGDRGGAAPTADATTHCRGTRSWGLTEEEAQATAAAGPPLVRGRGVAGQWPRRAGSGQSTPHPLCAPSPYTATTAPSCATATAATAAAAAGTPTAATLSTAAVDVVGQWPPGTSIAGSPPSAGGGERPPPRGTDAAGAERRVGGGACPRPRPGALARPPPPGRLGKHPAGGRLRLPLQPQRDGEGGCRSGAARMPAPPLHAFGHKRLPAGWRPGVVCQGGETLASAVRCFALDGSGSTACVSIFLMQAAVVG